MARHFLTILTGRNLPKIRQLREPEPSIINGKTIADFATELPDFVRCPLVNAVLSLPFDTEYKSHERQVRSRTNCPVITTRRSFIAGSAENLFTDCAAK